MLPLCIIFYIQFVLLLHMHQHLQQKCTHSMNLISEYNVMYKATARIEQQDIIS